VVAVSTAAELAARCYDQAAPGFAAAADQQVYRLLAAPLAQAITDVIGADGIGPVLDVAAGTGAVGRYFSDVVAVDISHEQLRHNGAARRVRADGLHLPFHDGAFGCAVCGFGVNHVPEPATLVSELARVAPVVGLSTWQRPDVPYPPKQAVFDVLARRSGRARTDFGELLDRYTDAVGSVEAIDRLLRGAGLRAQVDALRVEIPWPGVDEYLSYRLSMPTSAGVTDPGLRSELRDVLLALPPEALVWRPGIIVGVGRR
jgi:ubiquinone/menaquinone biosynthesis C-methylase UbiE